MTDNDATGAREADATAIRLRWVSLGMAALPCLMMLTVLVPWFFGYGALSDDASSHTTTIATLASRIANGQGWWSTDYNLGFPMGLYYQPLPHVLGALLTLLLGGVAQAPLAYKLLVAFVLLAQPWALRLGLLRAGASQLVAGAAALLGPVIIGSWDFGYNATAVLDVGLYTQGWGHVALPLALGELSALLTRRGRFLTTALACALLASTHMFFAIAIVPIVAALAIAVSLFGALDDDPLAAMQRPSLSEFLVRLGTRTGRLVLAGLLTFCLLAPWLIALQSSQSYFGGWPFGAAWRHDGVGLGGVLERLANFTAMDGPSMISQWLDGEAESVSYLDAGLPNLPILTLLAAAGLIWVVLDPIRDRFANLIRLLLPWSLLGLAGRATASPDADIEAVVNPMLRQLARVVDWYPLHDSVQLFRYSAMVQFTLLCMAATALAALLTLVMRRWNLGLGLVVVAVLAATPLARGYEQWQTHTQTFEDSRALDFVAYMEMVEALRSLPEGGRVLVGPRTGVRGHYHSGYLAYMARRPMAQSYGVGLHDSLHFYTLEFLNPAHRRAIPLLPLYDFRYVLSSPRTEMAAQDTREIVFENGRYRVSRVPGDHHAAAVMSVAETRSDTPRSARVQIREWLNGNGPATGCTVRLDVPTERDRNALTRAERNVSARWTCPTPAPPSTMHASGYEADRAWAHVDAPEGGWLVFKMGYHPFWTATRNGEPVETSFVFPGYLAIELPPGTSEVEAYYRWPLRYRLLWLLFFPGLLGAWWLDRRQHGAGGAATPTTPDSRASNRLAGEPGTV